MESAKIQQNNVVNSYKILKRFQPANTAAIIQYLTTGNYLLPPKRLRFRLGSLVCRRNYSKIYGRIFMKFPKRQALSETTNSLLGSWE